MSAVEKKHKNVDFYIIDGEGHCSFGLYYPLQDEGFQEWVSPIVKEGIVLGNNRPSAVCFLASVALGAILVLFIRAAASQKNRTKLLTDDEAPVSGLHHQSQRIPEAMPGSKASYFIKHLKCHHGHGQLDISSPSHFTLYVRWHCKASLILWRIQHLVHRQ
jgi:hypothetical protein